MKVLVTGADGFTGKSLCKALSEKGIEVIALRRENGNITDAKTFAPYYEMQIDHIFHLAASSYVPDSWKNVPDFIHNNVIGTTHLLELCKSTNASFTFVSSYMYGVPIHLPISENHPTATPNPYALSKKLAEEVCMFYAKEFNIKMTIVRPFNIYGPGQRKDFLIPTIINQVLNNECIIVNDLKPKRDYLFLDDFIAALLETLNINTNAEVFNIGSGNSYSVEEIINIIQKLAGTEKKVISKNLSRPNEIPDVVADITKLNKLTSWRPVYSLESGLRKCIEIEIK